ncbi:uncharacterized protein A1O9_04287 [Exophiala aquamarina CBS 119918]|uniref:3-oxoacyl-[acyl-carrier protein] reductase n=1 Tax=Exophiala aquamarina CBS 119918 TaxID=1182545 RepID=A0A072PJF7_9EURO|nr:uncharacterized protein A1O9_04287 [Exophiala aquamarina CBS 119918]KEF59443.1 hypothetical protein A1O9_04287 [Exophiala aquamarina CBS 119918]
MTKYEVKDSELEALRGKTVLIIGAASGIGRATVLLAHRKYPLSYFAEVDLKYEGADVLRLWCEKVTVQRRAIFRKCDMAKWDDVVGMFEATWRAFGQIDVVLANAGIHSEGDWLTDAISTTDGNLLPPDMNTIRVNLDGTIYVTKCAMHYFARQPDRKTQLVFTGSAARYA